MRDPTRWAMPPWLPQASIADGGGLRLNVFLTLVATALCLVLLALAIQVVRKRRRDRYIREVLTLQRRLESGSVESFTAWKRPDVQPPTDDSGTPRTIVSEGRYVYTQSGEVLRFSSSLDTGDDGVVTSALSPPDSPGTPEARPSVTVPFVLRRLVALHRSGIAIVAVDSHGRVERGDGLEPELLMALEDLLDQALAKTSGAATASIGAHTVQLQAGSPFHLAAIVDGEPDDGLDRELRWAQGDLRESLGTNPTGDADGRRRLSFLATLVRRMTEVFAINRDATTVQGGAVSRDGNFVVTTNVALRHGLLEFIVGLSNRGPGAAYDVQVLPNVGPEGAVEIVSAHGVEVDAEGLFTVPEVPEGRKSVATFLFRPTRTGAVKAECTVVLLRGLADVQDVRPSVRWVELEGIQAHPGEHVEPERVLEIALQPAAFSDCLEVYLPTGVPTEGLMQTAVDALRREMRFVVQLDDPSTGRIEAWFYTDLTGGASLVTCIAHLPATGTIGLFSAATGRAPVPAAMLMLRGVVGRAAGAPLVDATEGAGRHSPCRGDFMLSGSWGSVDIPAARGP
jgi:hypothetical protein